MFIFDPVLSSYILLSRHFVIPLLLLCCSSLCLAILVHTTVPLILFISSRSSYRLSTIRMLLYTSWDILQADVVTNTMLFLVYIIWPASARPIVVYLTTHIMYHLLKGLHEYLTR